MNTSYKYLDVSVEDDICLLTLDREKQLNALNLEVIRELRNFLEESQKESYKGIIFNGAGEKAFIAGADIKEMVGISSEEAKTLSYEGQQVSLMFEESQLPIIAAVSGFALGGGLEMALSCDFIMSTDNSKFGLPEVSLGLIPGFGGTQRLAKVIGRNRAKELLYTGRMIGVDEAKSIGLCLESFESKSELIEAAKSKLKKMFRNSPLAIAQVKYVLNKGVDLPNSDGLDCEKEQFGRMFDSQDMKEGTAAFIEKRKAIFTGK